MKTEGSLSGSIFLNRNDRPLISSAFIDAAESLALTPHGRVLIFSVDENTRLLLQTFLQIWNYQTVESDQPENLLTIIENENPDLILLDSFIPFAANLELIHQIRKSKSFKDIPVVMLSGFATSNIRELSFGASVDDLFVKPVNFDILNICLQENIEKYTKKRLQQGDTL